MADFGDRESAMSKGGVTVIEQLPMSSPKVLGFKMSGKLHDEDYKTFVPLVEDAVAKEGKIRLLAQFHDFHGWDMHALWDDIKFSTKHCLDVERIALVGEKNVGEVDGNRLQAFHDGQSEILRRFRNLGRGGLVERGVSIKR